MRRSLILAATVTVVMELELVVCCLVIGETYEEKAVNIAILVLGTSIGWLFGTALSPYDSVEKTQFSEYAKAVSAFLSGYFLSKIDKSVAAVFSPESLSHSDSLFRIILLFSTVLIATLGTFVNRSYAIKAEAAAKEAAAKEESTS